jgi:pyruvate formate lyase activating enzyme
MSSSDRAVQGLSKRRLLKAGVGIICALCVARVQLGTAQARTEGPGLGLVRPRPGAWFREEAGNAVRCELCPWQCLLAPGERARCRVRANQDGVGQTLAYGNPVLVQEDPVERLPFHHVRPGSRTLSVSTAGCNLACKFCEVWDMALVDPRDVHAHDLPPGTVIDFAKAANLPSVSYAFGEPVAFYEYMFEIAERARDEGLLNLLQTAAFIQPRPLKALSGRIDAANVDLKGFDARFYRDVCGGELQPVLDSLVLLKEAGVHLEITNILIPTLNDDTDGIARMCAWIRDTLGPDVPVHFSRFYPLYQLANLPQTPVSTLDRAREIALEAGLQYVYVARVTGHTGGNTFCPNCGNMLIRRVGFIIDEMRLVDGHCPDCDTKIPGRWH